MDKQLLEELSIWEETFDRAIRLGFIHLSASEFDKIALLYAKVFDTALSKRQMKCNTCRLKALKDLGKRYFEEKNKPKKGRPKKIDIDAE